MPYGGGVDPDKQVAYMSQPLDQLILAQAKLSNNRFTDLGSLGKPFEQYHQ